MRKILLLTLLLFAVFFSVAPVVHVVAISLREGNSFASSGRLFETITFAHFENLLSSTPFFVWLRNSLVVSASVTALGVSVAAFSGYALSRWAFRGRRWAMLGILVSQMFPCTFFLLPFYLLLAKLRLVDTFLGLTVIYSATALPFCVWQMKGYFDTIPRDLEEAARLDGCSAFGAFWRVVLPVSLPAL
ncbi:MAG: ABC transporter permease subunit, partial [Bdellovibrionales bacterium]|nr:ABC transporter permease subunit [Bdellovibrionales bacterium]